MVLADAHTVTVFACAPQLMVLTNAAVAAVFAMALYPLILTNPAAPAVFALVPHPLVLQHWGGVRGGLAAVGGADRVGAWSNLFTHALTRCPHPARRSCGDSRVSPCQQRAPPAFSSYSSQPPGHQYAMRGPTSRVSAP